MIAAHIIVQCRKYTSVQGPCFNKVNHFHCSVQNLFQAVRHSLSSTGSRWMLQCTQVASGATKEYVGKCFIVCYRESIVCVVLDGNSTIYVVSFPRRRCKERQGDGL